MPYITVISYQGIKYKQCTVKAKLGEITPSYNLISIEKYLYPIKP